MTPSCIGEGRFYFLFITHTFSLKRRSSSSGKRKYMCNLVRHGLISLSWAKAGTSKNKTTRVYCCFLCSTISNKICRVYAIHIFVSFGFIDGFHHKPSIFAVDDQLVG